MILKRLSRVRAAFPLFAGLLAIALISTTAYAAFVLCSGQVYDVGARPYAIATGDFNSDGKTDLVVSDPGSNMLFTLPGDGVGRFGTASETYKDGLSPAAIAVADFNGDNRPDVVTTGSNSVALLLNNGAGSFAEPTSFALGGAPEGVAAADFNGDGKADVAVTSTSAFGIAVLLGDGAGGLSAPARFGPAGTRGIVAGDFNRDGKTDLFCGAINGSNVWLYLGDGAGGFATPRGFEAGIGPEQVAAGDFNGDGALDLAVTLTRVLPYQVLILLNNGAGLFSPSGSGVTDGFPLFISVGDFDADGKQDMAVSHAFFSPATNYVSIFPGDGTGHFAAATTFTMSKAIPTAFADFNRDGKSDLVIAGYEQNVGKVRIFFNSCNAVPAPSPTPPAVKYTISGRITPNSGSWTTVKLSGTRSGLSGIDTVTGAYQFTNLPAGGNYTVTPSNSRPFHSYVYDPPSRTFNNLSANEVADFTEREVGPSISGQVLNGSGTPVPGITVTLHLGAGGSTQTDAQGRYSFVNLTEGGFYRVSPVSDIYGFSPGYYDFFNLTGNNNTANFTTVPLYTISGRAVDRSGAGIAGATVYLNGANFTTATTDNNGNYSFGRLPEGGNYTISMSRADYIFSPSNLVFNNLRGDQQSANFTGTRLYQIGGRVTDDKGDGISRVTMSLSGSKAGTAETDAAGYYLLYGVPEGGSYRVAPSKAGYTFAPVGQDFNDLGGNQTANFQGTPIALQFNASAYTVSEGEEKLLITVVRTGDKSSAATVKYSTADTTDANFNCNPNTPGQATGLASRKCDYHIAVGKLRFAPGEESKQFTLSIVNDVYVEGDESFTLTLSNPTGAILGQNKSVQVAITDDDGPNKANPISDTQFYVRQLYVDLLSREPDPAGWSGWTSRIDLCGRPDQAPPPCDRVTVGGDGFLRSGEFFDRQFFVLRLYRTGLGRILRYDEIADLAYVSGFLTAEQLELNKQDLVNEMVLRSEFANRYNPLGNSAFVATLLQTAAVSVPQATQDDWAASLNAGSKTRAQVFREISERPEVSNRYAHEAQVVSAYYGFFTRNPDGAYLNYLQRLDSGEINLADLANAFINAQEYRQRFGQ